MRTRIASALGWVALRVSAHAAIVMFPGNPGPAPSSAPAPMPKQPVITAPSSGPIQQRALNPTEITHVPVSTNRLTTIRFPSPISDLVSVAVAVEPNPKALFQVLFHPGESFFSLRAMSPGASTSLNVGWKLQTYVFELTESTNPCLSLNMVAPDPRPPRRTPPPHPEPVPTPSRPSLIEMAKTFHSTKARNPSAMPGVTATPVPALWKSRTQMVQVEELFRFAGESREVLKLCIWNGTKETVHMRADSLAISRDGKPVSVLDSDFDGISPSFGTVVVHVLIDGPNPTGNAPAGKYSAELR